jgi:cytochrome c
MIGDGEICRSSLMMRRPLLVGFRLVLLATMMSIGCTTSTDRPGGDVVGCPVSTPEAGFRSLFDGTQDSLDAWRQAGPGGFELRNCELYSYGGLGLLWHTQPVEAYELRVDWRLDGDDNSGVFVGFPAPGDDPSIAIEQGREVQIDATDRPEATTGAIYDVLAPDIDARDEALHPPGEWNTFAIVVDGDHLTVALNGEVITDYRDSDPGRLVAPGHIGIQNHSAADEVSFRNVRIRALDPS